MTYHLVAEDSVTGTAVALSPAYSTWAKFVPEKPITGVQVYETATYTEIGTAAGTDAGHFASIDDVKVTIGGQERPLLRGLKETDRAASHGMLGEVMRYFQLRSVESQLGAAVINKSGAHARGCVFWIPIQSADCVSRNVTIQIIHTASTWNVATGDVGVNTVVTRFYADYCDSLDEYNFQVDTVGPITGAVEKSISIPEFEGYYCEAVMMEDLETAAYEDRIAGAYVKSSSGIIIGQQSGAGMKSTFSEKRRPIQVYSATPLANSDPNNEGIYVLMLQPTKPQALKLWITGTAAMAAANITCLFIYRREKSEAKAAPPKQLGESAGTSSSGGTKQAPSGSAAPRPEQGSGQRFQMRARSA